MLRTITLRFTDDGVLRACRWAGPGDAVVTEYGPDVRRVPRAGLRSGCGGCQDEAPHDHLLYDHLSYGTVGDPYLTW